MLGVLTERIRPTDTSGDLLARLAVAGAGLLVATLDGVEAGSPEFGTGVFSQRPYLDFLRSARPDLPLVLEHLPFDAIPAAMDRVHARAATLLGARSR